MLLTGCGNSSTTQGNNTTGNTNTQSTKLTVDSFTGKTYQIGDSDSTLTFTTQNAITTDNGFTKTDLENHDFLSTRKFDDGRISLKLYKLSPDSPYSGDKGNFTTYGISDQCPALSTEDDDLADSSTPWKTCAEGTIFLLIPNVLSGQGGHSISFSNDTSYYVRSEEGKLTMTQLQYDPEDPDMDWVLFLISPR
jgi:hypothetical protein